MTARPTYRLIADGSLVWPEGYDPAAIEALPAGYYDPIDLAAGEAALIAKVDARREEMRAAVMTPGAGQSYAYAQKAAEVADHRRIAPAELAEMDTAATIARFPFAMAEAAASGDSLAAVIDRFDAGMALSRSEIARVEAVACAGKRAIRAAEGLPAKQAAFYAIAWTAD
ncbi:hypothetical protein [Sphingobium yanoikuyae]|uniref:hypothetical protein n=1 Tax=Sphingobium yanoikuyae TaxID=13690 RepID=UPI0028A6AB84|nr:hypothetical protein [Sphingobium yanoikuyae]